MTDDSVIEEAAKALDKNFNPDKHPIMAAMFRDYAATCLAVFEKAHALTGDEREMLARRIAEVLSDFTGESYAAESYHLADALLRDGFRRSEVPEPQSEGEKR